VHHRRLAGRERLGAGAGGEDFLVVLYGLGALVRGAGPAQLPVEINQHHSGGLAVGSEVLITWAAGVSFAILPLAIGAAVARYRLYDLDHIISRTLAYGLLTVLLGGGYAAVVLLLGRLLGRNSSPAVAGATLAVAAVFQPARGRIQHAVDRRFNRRHYDTSQTIAAFSARLREQVDLDTLSTDLLAVAEQTMEPTILSLWLRPPMERSGRSNS
jgi:hypothetical protein